MSWFRRDKPPDEKLPMVDERGAPCAHRGSVAEVRSLPPDYLEKRAGGQLERLPQVRSALPHGRRLPPQAAPGRRPVSSSSTPNCAPPIRSHSSTASLTASAWTPMRQTTKLSDALISAAVLSTAARFKSAPWRRASSAAAWARWWARRSRGPSNARSAASRW
jgi:hypothetical protein